MKKLIILVLIGAACSNQAIARCTGFNDEAKFLGKIAKGICGVAASAATGGIKVSECDKAISTASGIASDAVSWWNDMSNNGPSAIGPRDISLNKEDHGKLITPAGRLWIVDKPVAGDKKVSIKYRDGKAGVMVDICKVDANGNVDYLDYFEIPKKSKTGKSRIVTVKDGGWLYIDMKATGGLLTSYSYGIEVSRVKK